MGKQLTICRNLGGMIWSEAQHCLELIVKTITISRLELLQKDTLYYIKCFLILYAFIEKDIKISILCNFCAFKALSYFSVNPASQAGREFEPRFPLQ